VNDIPTSQEWLRDLEGSGAAPSLLLFIEAQLANSVAEAYRKNHTVEG
jgi:hypothetical protein